MRYSGVVEVPLRPLAAAEAIEPPISRSFPSTRNVDLRSPGNQPDTQPEHDRVNGEVVLVEPPKAPTRWIEDLPFKWRR